jgi:hypothetical protein
MNAKRIYTFIIILTLALNLTPGVHSTRATPEAVPPDVNEASSQAVTLPEGVSTDWWAQAQAYIQQSEYEISWQEPTYLPDLHGAYQAPNRAQGLRTYFTAQGLRIVERTETQPAWQLGISLAGYGDLDNLMPAGVAVLSPLGNRMDYQRTGVAEWYLNDESGLQQNFGLPLTAVGASSELVPAINLDLALQGNLIPVLIGDGKGVEFFTPDGSLVLRYGDLQAVDANGQATPVGLSLLFGDVPDEVTLRLALPALAQPVTLTARLTSPLGAAYAPDSLPVTHDWTYKNKTLQGAHAYDGLGISVGTAGDVDGDGYSDILAGALGFDNGQVDEGRVFLWYGSPEGLCELPGEETCEPDWTAEGDSPSMDFGYSVGTAGDVNGDGYDDIIVGAPWYDNIQGDEGAVFVWYGAVTGLGPNGTPTNADWQAESDQVSALFGFSVGTAGDVNGDGFDDIVVGAYLYNNPEDNEGGVFVWHGSATGLCENGGGDACSPDWRHESDLAAAGFGYSVGTAGDVNADGFSDLIVGTPYSDEGGTDCGKAYVWYGSSDGLGDPADPHKPPDWSAIGGWGGHWFGHSVSTAGDVNGDGYSDIVVGARYYNYGESNEGAVYVYYGAQGGLSTSYWRYESNQANTELGFSVSAAGDVNGDGYADILVGAPRYDNGQTDEGAAYLWYGSAHGMGFWQRPPDWKVEINHTDDRFGCSVASAGDVNGDGYSDILVGALGTDDGGTYDVGQVYAYYGSPGSPLTFAGGGRPETQYDAQLGYTVSTAGDVNGDGYSDIIVGAPSWDQDGNGRGKVYVWYGAADSWWVLNTAPDWESVGETAGSWFGCSAGTAGDVNGDGYDDIIVGAHYYPNNTQSWGAVYVWYGSPGGLGDPLLPDWRAYTNKYATNFGYSVGTAGDVNGDGYDDIIVGAPWYDNNQTDEGAVFVWEGSATGLGDPGTLDNADWKYESNQTNIKFGYSAGTAGDLNGDGASEIIVGTFIEWNGPLGGRGRAYVWYGSNGTGLGPSQGDPDWMAEGLNNGARFGMALSTAGDVNGDGYSDVLIGANGGSQAWWGAVFAWYGSAMGLCEDDQGAACAADWMYESRLANTQLGNSVGPAGDVNGDGYADILVGAPYFEAGQTDEGAVYIFLGSADGMGSSQRAPDWRYEIDHVYDHFGYSLGTAGDMNGDGYSDIIIGAPGTDEGSTYDVGQVYLFYGSEQTPGTGAPDELDGEQENAQLGYSVGGAGDVNGDGYSDVIIGVPYFDRGQSNEGIVYVYYGSATGIVTNTIWLAESNQASAELGKAVSSAGDVNGDGYSDILVGAPGYDNGQNEEGAVFVWHGSLFGMGANGTPGTANWQAEADQAQAFFGSAVATAGDVNGDGYSDVIAGAYGYDYSLGGEGQARVYYGSASGLAAASAWTAGSDQAGAAFGRSVGSAGDVNGDGYSEVIVGAYKYTAGETAEGRAFVYYGAQSGLSSSANWVADGDQAYASFGYAVGTVGDVNGDGYSDVIVGAYQFDHGDWPRDYNEGAAFVWYGSAAGLGANGNPENAGWLADGDQAGAQFGYVVGTAGDVNSDGYSDVLVGSQAYNNGPVYEGRVFVYYGASGGPSLMARWTAEGDQEGAALGSSAAAAGDVNGDGFADVIVGAPTFDHVELVNTDEDVGQARVYYGNGGSVLSLRPRQLRTGAANPPVPIAPLGVSNSTTSVQLRLTGLMPLGRERVKLEWQIAPLGTPFTATTVITGTSPAWIDTGNPLLAREEIAVQVNSLAPGTNYRWRVRLVYSGNRLGLSVSRWFGLAWNGWQELDFRTPSAPPVLLNLYLPVVKK